jgi:hypothetical protein
MTHKHAVVRHSGRVDFNVGEWWGYTIGDHVMWLARTAEHPSCLTSKCYRQGRMIHPFGIIYMRAHKQTYAQIWHIVRQIVSLFHLTISSFWVSPWVWRRCVYLRGTLSKDPRSPLPSMISEAKENLLSGLTHVVVLFQTTIKDSILVGFAILHAYEFCLKFQHYFYYWIDRSFILSFLQYICNGSDIT